MRDYISGYVGRTAGTPIPNRHREVDEWRSSRTLIIRKIADNVAQRNDAALQRMTDDGDDQ